MKTLLMVQPGPYGDILICATIAKWYADQGYKILWPARKEFHPMLKRFDYVTPLLLNEDKLDEDWLRSDVMKIIPTFGGYNKILNLADRGPGRINQLVGYENFEQCKFREAYVPFIQKYNLSWTRDLGSEDSLMKHVNPDNKEYVFAHLGSSKGAKAIVPEEETLPVIESKEYIGYDMVDWYGVVVNARAVYCTESSFQALIDGFGETIYTHKKLFLINREAGGSHTTVAEHWDKRYLL